MLAWVDDQWYSAPVNRQVVHLREYSECATTQRRLRKTTVSGMS